MHHPLSNSIFFLHRLNDHFGRKNTLNVQNCKSKNPEKYFPVSASTFTVDMFRLVQNFFFFLVHCVFKHSLKMDSLNPKYVFERNHFKSVVFVENILMYSFHSAKCNWKDVKCTTSEYLYQCDTLKTFLLCVAHKNTQFENRWPALLH